MFKNDTPAKHFWIQFTLYRTETNQRAAAANPDIPPHPLDTIYIIRGIETVKIR